VLQRREQVGELELRPPELERESLKQELVLERLELGPALMHLMR
jgi:hypothetical protein